MKNFTLTFSEAELETIANAMEDYMQYDDEKLNTEFLFGGLSVADRVNSINSKIDEAFNNYVDMLNKDGLVTDYQAYNWSNPF